MEVRQECVDQLYQHIGAYNCSKSPTKIVDNANVHHASKTSGMKGRCGMPTVRSEFGA